MRFLDFVLSSCPMCLYVSDVCCLRRFCVSMYNECSKYVLWLIGCSLLSMIYHIYIVDIMCYVLWFLGCSLLSMIYHIYTMELGVVINACSKYVLWLTTTITTTTTTTMHLHSMMSLLPLLLPLVVLLPLVLVVTVVVVVVVVVVVNSNQ